MSETWTRGSAGRPITTPRISRPRWSALRGASRTPLPRVVSFEEARGGAEIVNELVEARVAVVTRPAQDARGVYGCQHRNTERAFGNQAAMLCDTEVRS